MTDLRTRRLGQYLAGEIFVEGFNGPCPPEQFTDAPRRTFPDGATEYFQRLYTPASHSWVLADAPPTPPSYYLSWTHPACGGETSATVCEERTHHLDPAFYTALYCVRCRTRVPVADLELRTE